MKREGPFSFTMSPIVAGWNLMVSQGKEKARKLVKADDKRDNVWRRTDEQPSGWLSDLVFLDVVELMARRDR